MKGRSQQQQCRMPAPATAAEDWVDGSWTVDCSCGVTFDDGEEMVSCDDCGVWVHTRCARFVRGRDASFVCHNCKAAARRLRSADDQLVEESEVAQLLLDMPNQADAPLPIPRPPAAAGGGGGGIGGGQPPPTRPRFWSEIPLEDRVHVQGVPGGDPALFPGLSSVFGCQLWRCAGYVPKKFSFRYKEFPCWDDDEEDRGNVEEEKIEEKDDGDNSAASKGADMLFSLSNNIFPPYASVAKVEDMKGVDDDKVSSGGSGRSMNSGKKERNKIRAAGHHSVKRKKDDTGEGKERSGKTKRFKSGADSAMVDNKKRGISFLPGTKSSDVHGNRNSQAKDSDVASVKCQHQQEGKLAYSNYSNLQQGGKCKSEEPKSLVDNKNCMDASSEVGAKEKGMKETCLKDENVVQTVEPEIPPAVDAVTQGEGIDLADDSHMDEVENPAGCCLQQFKGVNNFEMGLTKGPCHSVPILDNLRPTCHDHMSTSRKMPEDQLLPDTQETHSKLDNTEDMISQQVDQSTVNSKFPNFPGSDGKINGLTAEPLHGPSFQISDVRLDLNDHTCLPSHENKWHGAEKESSDRIHKRDEVERGVPYGVSRAEELVPEPSVEKDSLDLRKNSSDEHSNLVSQDSKKMSSDMLRSEAGVIKKFPATFSSIISRSSVSVTSPGIVPSSLANDDLSTKQPDKVSTCVYAKKECLETAICAEGTTAEASKESEKGYLSSRSKSSQTTKISYLSTSKHVIPGAKEPSPSRLSKASTKEDALTHLNSLDGSGSSVHAKTISTKCPKNEKIHHSVPYPTSKSLYSSNPLHTSQSANTSTTLSDEELALLLHQELNSSPRVPRVPRMRQAVGMQSGTTSSTSMLSRRSSVPSGKDQSLVFRRKNKDDRWRGHNRDRHDSNDVSRRKHRMPSPDHQYHKSSFAKKDRHNRSTDALLISKKNSSVTSAESTSSEPSSSEASGRSSLLFHSSPKEVPKEDISQTPRTLPGLIDEIMSKDGHKTYEELCDAVRLHWDDLRKPNGERYAYASHVHAVHDCLRNRSEWAHLIDQVPKTNASKRRRKAESELPKVESENKRAKTRANKEGEENSVDSHREDYPKGKRKARKRRLEILGKSFKESRSKQIEDAASDDDHTAFSQSSNEGNDSSDDSQDNTGSDDEEGTELSSSGSDDSD